MDYLRTPKKTRKVIVSTQKNDHVFGEFYTILSVFSTVSIRVEHLKQQSTVSRLLYIWKYHNDIYRVSCYEHTNNTNMSEIHVCEPYGNVKFANGILCPL